MTHDDLATLEASVAWDELQLPGWVDEYNRNLYGRPPRPVPEEGGAGKKKRRPGKAGGGAGGGGGGGGGGDGL